MALYIRNPEARRLACALADATGETVTKAVIQALRERLERLRVRQEVGRAERAARLMAHGEKFAALPVSDWRSGAEIIDYDEIGLPR